MQEPENRWQLLLRRYRIWRSLSALERGALYRLLLLQYVAGLYLRLGGFDYARTRMQRRGKSVTQHGLGGLSMDRLAELARMAGRVAFFRAACLERSLALRSLLGRYGIESEIRIGIMPDSDTLQAHAWVEVNGEAIDGGVLDEFHAFSTLERPKR